MLIIRACEHCSFFFKAVLIFCGGCLSKKRRQAYHEMQLASVDDFQASRERVVGVFLILGYTSSKITLPLMAPVNSLVCTEYVLYMYNTYNTCLRLR